MPRIFISYRRSDSSTVSGRIYDHLVTVFGDDNVFKDVYDIPAGSDFRKVIEENINASNIQLIIIGPGWIDVKAADGTRRLDDPDDSVRIEVETGLNCRDIRVIPVLVSGATMPGPAQLPEALRDLSFRNAVVIRDDPDFREDIRNLIKSLRGRQVERSRRLRRTLSILFATVVFAAVIVTAAVLIVRSSLEQRADLNKTATAIIQMNTQVSALLTGTAQAAVIPTLHPTDLPPTPTATTPPSATIPAPTSAVTTIASVPTRDVAGAVALIKAGDTLQEQDNYAEALQRYADAIALDPTNAEAYISHASVLALIGTDLDEAIQDAQKAIQLAPNEYWNYDELGKIYYAAEKYDLSVQAYTKALTLQSNPSGYLGRGSAYRSLGDYTHALADLTQAIKLDPTDLDVYVERAWTNYDAKHYKDAIADFSAVIEQNPQADNSFVGRGKAYRELGDLTNALNNLDHAISINPDSADAYYERGYTHQLNDDPEAARDDYNEVLKRDPNYANAYIGLARLNLDTFSNPDAALQYALQAVNLAESNPYAQMVLGDVYYQQGQKENALAHYQRYVELIGAVADPNILARIHELEGT
jgi:tetratricopeptide (TPR) repeat protein